jgi:hypothetical protein
MGAWYTLGVSAGLAAACGVLLAGVLARIPRGPLVVAALTLAAGIAIGLGVWGTGEAIAGAVGGLLGGFGAATIARGALGRGGTRGGLALLLAAAAIVVALLALVPVVGYLEPLVLLVLAARIRARSGSRYAGLRILARD